MNTKRKLAIVLSIGAAIPAAFAQPPEPGRNVMIMRSTAGAPVMGAEMNYKFISSEFSFDGATVKNAPYSAEAVSETTQRLADGNRISQKSTTLMYRDSEGRTRREETLGAIGLWAAGSEPVRTVFINDPAGKTNLVLDSRTKTARKMPSPEIHMLPPLPGAGAAGAITVQADMVKRVIVNRSGVGGAVEGGATFTQAVPAPINGDTQTESLGSQVIEGVRADGTRTTMTIPAGAMGNDLPIQVVSERWYSPELQTVVMTKRSDPRMGDTTYRLSNISRSEPPRSLFEAPADYTVVDDSAEFKRAAEKAAKEKSKE